jgi:hypothetical protein
MDIDVEIKQYLIVEHIGRGGMADVWSARDQNLGRMVAIKTISQTLAGDTDPIEMFKREARIIAGLDHPHILPIYDFGEYEGQLYIVMRYVAGGSLEDLLRRGPVPVMEALRLGEAIAKALDFAHQNDVIHLDLKPPNVLLDSHQSPYLADFGLATALDPGGKAINPGAGTLLYMAPEQLTSETIDHRADIYSFAIVMFHMLTGNMPFDASMPLAFKQMQFHDDLPDPDTINPALPAYLGDILRRSTSLDPIQRPESLIEFIDDLRDIITDTSGISLDSELFEASYESPSVEYDGLDMEILEAVDIYSRARHNWAAGNGRFLLGVTHFMIMNGYYMNAEEHGLEIDLEGTQMILRGALEYDHELTYWWGKLDDENCRWVCLHALRSGNAPARARSLFRLETTPDSEPPQIPRLVAQALNIETDEEARLAGLQVLGTRAKLMKPKQQIDIKTEYRGRMLTTLTRLGVQINPPHDWTAVIYTPEIDELIAETALDKGMPKVADFAARIIGRIRSEAAVAHISEQQREGRKGALRALALIRDEAPTLPSVVSTKGRMYAWIANTLRRMFDDPLQLVFRFAAALLGGWLAMGVNIWITYRAEAIFTPQRWGNTLAVGLMFGVFIAILVTLTDEFSARLRGFWPWWVRLLMSATIGLVIATFTWAQFTWLYLHLDIMWNVMFFGGIGLTLGFLLTPLLNLRSYVAIPITAALTYIPLYVTYQIGWKYETVWPFSNLGQWEFSVFWQDDPLRPFNFLNFQGAIVYYDYFAHPNHIYSVAIPVVLLLAIGAHFPSLAHDLIALVKFTRKEYAKTQPIPIAESTPLEPITPKQLVADPGGLKTEMDISHGGLDADPYPATEMDLNQGIPETTPDAPDLSTELDANLGTPHDESSINNMVSRRVDAGSGIRVDSSGYQTELDTNQGESQDGSLNDMGPSRVDVGSGIRIDEPDSQTELDANLGHLDKSQRTDLPSGIRIDDGDMNTELDINKKKDEDD